MDIVELGFRVDTRDIATASNDLDRLGGAGTAADGSLGGLAKSLAGIAALVAGGIGLSEMAGNSREFSDAMAEVSTLVNTATFNIGELADEALRMAGEFGSAPVEQSKAFYQAISAGASTAEQAIAALDAANRLAVGGVTSVEVAVDGLTSVMNAYGGEAGSFTDISDTMFVGMKAGKTTVEELSQNIGKLAPLASTAGASFGEVIAATAALTKGGVATSTAMDGLRAIMAAVVKPSGEAADMAEELGIKFNAAGLQSMGLAGFLEHLGEKTGGSTEQLALLFGGVEALTPILALTGKSSADFAAILGDMGNKAGETQAAFDKMAASPGFQMDRILSSLSAGFTGLGTSIFDSAAPALKSIADTIPGAFAAVDDAISGAQTAWQTFADAFRFSDDRVFVMLRDIGDAIRQIGIYAAPVVPYLDDFAFALVGIGAGAVVITGLAAAFALLTSPITLTAAAIGVLAVATVELYRNWDAVSVWWDGVWGGMKTTAETFVSWWNTTPIEEREITIDTTATELAQTAVQGFATFWNDLPFLPQALQIETDTIIDATAVVADFISSTANGIAGLADDILAADIGGALSGMWDEAKAGAETAWGEITIALGYAFGDIKGLIDEVKLTVAALFDGPSNIGAIFEAGWASIVSITDLVWTVLTASIEAGWNLAVGVLTAGLQLLRGDFELAWQTIGGTVSELGTAIVDGFLSIGPQVTQAAVDLLESAKQGIIGIMPSWVPLIGQEAEQVGQAIPASMGVGISGSLSMVTDKIHEITASVVTTLSEVIPFMGSIGIAIIKALGDGLIAGLSMIRTAGQSVVDTIVEPFSAVGGSVSRMYEGGKNTVMGFANGILGSLGLVESASSELASIPDDVVRNDLRIQSPSLVMQEIGGHVSQGLADGITGGSAAVAEAAQRIADEVDRSMSRIAEQIEQRYVLLTQGEEAARRYELAHRGIIGADQDLIIAGEAINRHLEEEKRLRDELQQGIQQSIVNADSVRDAFSNLGEFMTDWLRQKIAEFAANKLMMYMGLDGTGFEGGFGGIIKTVANGLGLLGSSATTHSAGVSALAGNVDILGGNASGAMGAINLLSTGTGAAGTAASQAGASFGVLASDANAVGTASAGAAAAISTVVTVMGTVATANALSDKLHELAGVTDETASTIGKLAAGFGPVGAAIASAFGGAWEEVNRGFDLAFKDGALSGQAMIYMEKERSLWRGTATSIIYSELDAALSETVVKYFGELDKAVVSAAVMLGVEGAATIVSGVERAITTVKGVPVEEQLADWLEQSTRSAYMLVYEKLGPELQQIIQSSVDMVDGPVEDLQAIFVELGATSTQLVPLMQAAGIQLSTNMDTATADAYGLATAMGGTDIAINNMSLLVGALGISTSALNPQLVIAQAGVDAWNESLGTAAGSVSLGVNAVLGITSSLDDFKTVSNVATREFMGFITGVDRSTASLVFNVAGLHQYIAGIDTSTERGQLLHAAMVQMSGSLTDAGVVLGNVGGGAITTTAGLMQYIQAQDASTESGQQAIATALAQVPAIIALEEARDRETLAIQTLADTMRDLGITFDATGPSAVATLDAVNALDGGLQAFTTGAQNYMQAVYTEAELSNQQMGRNITAIQGFNDTMGLSGEQTITTTAGLRAYAEGLGPLNEANAAAYQAIFDVTNAVVAWDAALDAQITTTTAVAAVMADLGVKLDATSPSAGAAANAIVELMGGLDAFVTGATNYMQAVYSEAELTNLQLAKNATAVQAFNTEMGLSGEAFISTKEGLREYTESLGPLTEANASAYAAVFEVTDAMVALQASGLTAEQAIAALPPELQAAFELMNGSAQDSGEIMQAAADTMLVAANGISLAFGGTGVSMDLLSTNVGAANDAIITGSGTMSTQTQAIVEGMSTGVQQTMQALSTASVSEMDEMGRAAYSEIDVMATNIMSELGTLQADGTGTISGMGIDSLQHIATMAGDVVTKLSGMSADSIGLSEDMKTRIIEAMTGLRTDATSAMETMRVDSASDVAGMNTDVQGSVENMRTNVLQTMSLMNTGGVGQIDAMGRDSMIEMQAMSEQMLGSLNMLRAQGTSSMGGMGIDSLQQITGMATNIIQRLTSMSGSSVGLSEAMKNSIIERMTTLRNDASSAIATLQTNVASSAGGIRGSSITAVGAMSSISSAMNGMAGVSATSAATMRSALLYAGQASSSLSSVLRTVSRLGGTIVNGSHADGLASVPFNGYVAELHKGEMVVPADVSNWLRGAGVPVPQTVLPTGRAANDSGVTELQAIRKQLEAMQQQQAEESRAHEQAMAMLVSGNAQQIRTLKKVETANDRIARQIGR